MPGDDTPLRVPETKQARVKDHELRVDFLDTVAEQPLNKPDVRAVTKGLLEKTKEKRGGVPGLVLLIASTQSAVRALA